MNTPFDVPSEDVTPVDDGGVVEYGAFGNVWKGIWKMSDGTIYIVRIFLKRSDNLISDYYVFRLL